MLTERNKTLDAAKGIGILLVVMAHVNKNAYVQLAIYTFHMPLFFLIAGITFHPEKYASTRDLLRKKSKSLILPYLVFCGLGIIYKLLLLFRSNAASAAYFSFLWKALYSVVWAPYSLKYYSLFNTSMWFVPCLLLVEIMYYWISKHSDGKKRWGPVLVISFFGWLLETAWIGIDFSFLPWNFSSGCFSLVFFAVGHGIGEKGMMRCFSEKNGSVSVGKRLLFMFCFGAIALSLGFLNGKVSIGSRILNNGLLFAITGLTGSFAALIFSDFLQNCRFLNFCGKNSFVIMGSHFMVTDVTEKILAFLSRCGLVILPHIKAGNAVEGTVFAAIIIALCCLFTLVYNRIKKALFR